MNLTQPLSPELSLQPTNVPLTTIIEDQQPACALLNEQQQPLLPPLTDGNIPLPLTSTVAIRFHLIPNSPVITGIRLRFGTYCRTNRCHLNIQIGQITHRLNTHHLPDNEYTNIIFLTPLTVIPGQPLIFQIYAENTDENNVVALWCSQKILPFTHQFTQQPLHLATNLPPRVSIVIPIFNKMLYTYNCLLAIQACDQEISKEVILINNASTDDTPALLQCLQGAFTIIANVENQGFVQACRQGADAAKGEFILFLNNDTQVMPGWLTNMLKVMDNHAKVGITGSKLLYPDGRLQEAGGIIFNDASGWNYGRFQEPTDKRFNQNREVDYCSGASLMIRKTLWQQLGGFDTRYAPAYYEDTDLCFAARQTGHTVVYCHNSQVIHHEGITAGTDTQSGYKAYQLINQKKFQAKWWHVLTTHPPPPPQTSPDSAAFRFMPTKAHPFRIPKAKILATHFLAQGWAANFWSYINLKKVDEELVLIKNMGFNTIILLIPWVGFQTKVDPITYYEEYFDLLNQLLKKIMLQGLQVILRLGYTHDNGPASEPEGFLRQIVVAANPLMLTAWCHYLDRLWNIAQRYANVLGGFITWEDFFFMDLTHCTLEQRLLFAERTGYQNYLTTHYSIEEVSNRYKQTFSSHTQVPIPAFKSSAIHLFCEFWDKILLDTIFTTSKKHFPALTMEVRTDCDPQEDTHICHDRTFDLTPETYLSMIYYTPAWGSPNDGKLESAATILQRMQFMFAHIRRKTNNVIFIDQFNFIDNTPGFEHNTGILANEIPDFLTGVTNILQQQTIGYGLWTVRDVRANALKNGLFERNYHCWELEDGELVCLVADEKNAVLLNPGGILRQRLTHCVGVPLVKDMPFQLDFKLKAGLAMQLTVSIMVKQQSVYEKNISAPDTHWQDIHLENIPFWLDYELKLENRGKTPILLSHFYLYQLCQENGIMDVNGKPKFFYQHLVALNQQLSMSPKISCKGYFQRQDLTQALFNGIFVDGWMGKTLTGIIAKPAEKGNFTFLIKVYVPETWRGYQNRMTLILGDNKYLFNQSVKTGCQEFTLDLGEKSVKWEEFTFLQLEVEAVYSPQYYDSASPDSRQLSMQLLELGWVDMINSVP